MSQYLLGFDIGTTHVKAALCTADGRVLAQAQAAHTTDHPQPAWAEQDPNSWWAGLVEVTRQVAAQVDVSEIAAIGVSGQGCGVVLLDEAGALLHPAIIWMDSRSEPQSEWLRRQCGDAILRINGKSPAPYNADPVLLWLQENEPVLLERAAVSLTTTGYINHRLTGVAVTNHSDASILFAFDLARGDWSQELINAFGLPRRLYPRAAPSGTIIGGLTAEAAAALGLRAGTPVIAGGEDTSSAGLAMGAVAQGRAFLSLGTAGTLYAVEERPLVHPQLLAFRHVLPGQTLIGGSMAAIGGAFAWLRSALAPEESATSLLALAEQSPPGAGNLLFLPYLSGELQPINDGYARGVFFGLSMSSSRAHLVRAVLEGTAFAIAHNLELVEELTGPVADIRAAGGPTRSAIWCQIIADVCGRPVSVVAETSGAPLGNALLAGAAVGLIDDLAATADAASHVERRYTPDANHHAAYGRLFALYKRLYPALRGLYADLAT